MFIKLFLGLFFSAISIFAAQFNLNLKGTQPKENLNLQIDLEVDEEGKPKAAQKLDLRGFGNIKSIKLITASGLIGTLKDEREILIYYKTDLNVNGLKIRNLYKVAVARVYEEEKDITLNFDPDHYQNIISFLRYHNAKEEVIKDIDNMYGTWTEIENDKLKNEDIQDKEVSE